MKHVWVRRFITAAREAEPLFSDTEISLVPREYYGHSRRIRCEHQLIFDIVRKLDTHIIGEIALRVGDSPELFYLGHIGYHVDPPYRGNGYAAKACRLCEPMLFDLGMSSVVITTDPDNEPSVKTCIRLGCELESTVPVSQRVRAYLEISPQKRRYIWMLQPVSDDVPQA